MMNTEQRKLLEELFHQASEMKDRAERAFFVAQRCGEDRELKTQLQRMLQANDGSSVFMDRAAKLATTSLPKPIPPAEDLRALSKFLEVSNYPKSFGRLGKYEILGRIGKGGMGLVFRAIHTELHREVAIKIQIPSASLGQIELARFKSEARAVAKLDQRSNPHTVRIYDFEVNSDPPYIVFELLDGCDLAKLVKSNGPLSPEIAINYAIQAARGLAVAHQEGIIHRDVKPQNLMLTNDGTIKLLDLGLAKLPPTSESSTTEHINARSDSSAAGSAEFMSPEHTTALEQTTSKSDIYSLGCTLFWLLTGTPPFKGQNARETMDAHCKASRPSLDRFLKRNWHVIQLDALIRKMLAIDPEDRPSSMEDVINQLTAIADESVRRKREKRKYIAIIGAASAAAFAIVLFVRSLMPPNYEFELGSVYDEREVQTLVNLKDQISQVRDWHSGVSESSAQISQMILRTPNATTFKHCMKAGQNKDLRNVNSGLAKLLELVGEEIPRNWRTLSNEALTKEIASELKAEQQSQIRKKIAMLLQKEASQKVLRRWGINDFPPPSRPSYQDLWIAGLEAAIETDVSPTARWYDMISRTAYIEYRKGSAETGDALLFQLEKDRTIFDGSRSTADVNVVVRSTTAGASQTEVDTGITLVDCRLAEGTADRPVQLDWPAQKGVIDLKKLQAFLYWRGLPEAFHVTSTELVLETEKAIPCLAVTIGFTHEDFPACKGETKISIDGATERIVTWNNSSCEKAMQQVPDFLVNATSLRGFDVNVQKESGAEVFNCFVNVASFPKTKLIASIDRESGAVVLSGAPSLETQSEILKRICASNEKLKGMDSIFSLESFRIAGSPPAITIRTVLSNRNSLGFSAEIDPEGRIGLSLSRDLLTEVTQRKHELAAKTNPLLDQKLLLSELRAALDKMAIPDGILRVVSAECDEIGNRFCIGLSIGDWNEILLGPFNIESTQEVKSIFASRLNQTEIQKSVNEKWSQPFDHPRFGNSTAKLTFIDIHSGIASVETQMLLGIGPNPLGLTIPERVRTTESGFAIETLNEEDKTWVPSSEFALARRLSSKARAFCDAASDAASDMSGVKMRLEIDDSDRERPWLRLSPPSISMQASMRLPLPVEGPEISLGLGKIKIDRMGISAPKVAIVEPRMSIPCGNFTASDPRCEFDFETGGVKLGIKLTPPFPFPSTGVPATAREQMRTLYQVVAFRSGDIRWDNLFLHGGHLFVQIDGRFEPSGFGRGDVFVAGASGELIALEDTRLASSRGEVSIRDWQLQKLALSVDAALRPKEVNLGSVHGALTVEPPRSLFAISGDAEVAGIRLLGDISFDGKVVRQPLGIRAYASIPIIRKIGVTGTANLSFSDYLIVGEGVAYPPFCSSGLHCRLTATPKGIEKDWWWETIDGREVHYATSSPRLDLIDEATLAEELRTMIETSNDASIVQVDSLVDIHQPSAVARLNSPTGHTDNDISSRTEVDPETNPQSASGSPSFRVEGNNLEIAWTHLHGETATVVAADSLSLDDWSNSAFFYGFLPDASLFFAVAKFSDISGGGQIVGAVVSIDGRLRDVKYRLTQKEIQLAASRGTFHVSNIQSPGQELLRYGFGNVLFQKALGEEGAEVSDTDSTVIVDLKRIDSPSVFWSFFRTPGGSQGVLNFSLEQSALSEERVQFASGIKELALGYQGNDTVIAIGKHESKAVCAVITDLGHSEFLLQTVLATGVRKHRLNAIGQVEFRSLNRAAAQIANSIWRGDLQTEGEIFIGTQGLCIVEPSGNWHIAPAIGYADQTSMELVRIDKEKFLAWAGGSERSTDLVPKFVRSAVDCDSVAIAKDIVTDWETLKQQGNDERRWLAHPMGLLIESARIKSPATVE